MNYGDPLQLLVKGTDRPDKIGPRVVLLGSLYVRTFLVSFFYFLFNLDVLNGVKNSTAFHAQIYLIVNNFRGRQVEAAAMLILNSAIQ